LRQQNGEDIGRKRTQGTVILLPSVFMFDIDAILLSFGFDQFCPILRWHSLRYVHIPALCRLALNKIASNLNRVINSS
jgi:hypothetical protein